MSENILLTQKHVLWCDPSPQINQEELKYLMENFCGNVIADLSHLNITNATNDTILYMCGNICQMIKQLEESNITFKKIYVIDEFSINYEKTIKYKIISEGEVPINLYDVGVYFRRYFNVDDDSTYYNRIIKEHQFQSLTESNKPSSAFRKGIYLTKVSKEDDGINFKLLRCSTNLSGPTDNFRITDHEIVDHVNYMAQSLFEQKVELNHVLAQTYHNFKSDDDAKERRARISEHSDKTKDMPENGIMAFCSFYNFDNDMKGIVRDGFDYCYKNASVLTRLRFRLKKSAFEEYGKTLVHNFDITLYPNSVFLMSLSTNRLYTHEIMPSGVSINKIPTRMGYVIRCSDTEAVFSHGQTYIIKDNIYHPLEEPTDEGVARLKALYFKENTTIEKITYDGFYFSLNRGDYTSPII